MDKGCLHAQLTSAHKWFYNTIECLTENDSAFVPKSGMFSVAQQVAHVAQTIDWFMKGAFDPRGFDMDFAAAEAKVSFDLAIAKAQEVISTSSDADLHHPIAEGPIMGGHPRVGIIGAILEHTAHHRGSLAVYARLLGKTPKMPYSE